MGRMSGRMFGKIFSGMLVCASLSAAALAQNSQSLGDIARANREKEQERQASGETPRMITNQDLPASASAGIPQENPADPMTTVSGVQRSFRTYARAYGGGYQNGSRGYGERPFGQPGMGGQYAGDQLRGQIRQQENRVAELQARIARASATMHPNGSTVQYEGPLNRYQAVQGQRIEMMQQMLEQQRQRLAMMQDEARHQGAHTAVYEP
jgi:hypothetical protein